jgi:hypothetical protein
MAASKFDNYNYEIVSYMKEMEVKNLPDSNMIDIQPELDWSMRPHLIDFLLDCHYSLNLLPETLFLTMSIIDRYCSLRVVYKKHYQLVGCTALWIASKYEDKKVNTPTLKELTSMCCNAYDPDMFVQMESHILSTLEWSIGNPTIESFLRLHPDSCHLARFFCELSLYEREFIGTLPSTIASSAIILSNCISGQLLPAHVSPHQLNCINSFLNYAKTPSRSLAKKYSKTSFNATIKTVQNYLQMNPNPFFTTSTGAAPLTPPLSPVDFDHRKTTPPQPAHFASVPMQR